MTFVNSIAEIIHNTVKNYGGQANKNVGDAFLLVWKLKAEDEKINNITDVEVSQENNLIADIKLKLALVLFLILHKLKERKFVSQFRIF